MGVEVDPEARANLLAASQQVLAAVAEKIPVEAQYRLNVESTFEHWIEQVNLANGTSIRNLLQCFAWIVCFCVTSIEGMSARRHARAVRVHVQQCSRETSEAMA